MEDRQKRLREIEKELSPRHLRFARFVANGDNLTNAYCQTYPDVTRSTARTHGSRLLSKPLIAEYVELLTGESAESFIVSRGEVLQRLVGLAETHENNEKAANAVASALKTLLDYLAPIRQRAVAVELTGKDGGPVKTDVSVNKGLTPDMARAIMIETLGLNAEQADRLLGTHAAKKDDTDADGQEDGDAVALSGEPAGSRDAESA